MKTLLSVLLQIRKNVEAGKHDAACGICMQQEFCGSEELQLLNYDLMKGWPEHSNDECYPVGPQTPGLKAYQAYWRAGNKWKGGVRRRSSTSAGLVHH